MTDAPSLRWAAWFGDRDRKAKFPAHWEVRTCAPRGGADIGERGLRSALACPIQSPPLRELARGRQDAVVVVDDLSRPTPAWRLLPLVLEELVAGGIPQDKVRIILGVAAHPPMLRAEIVKKLGRDVAENLSVANHNVFDNTEFLGKTGAGTPVHINRDFLRAELKICVGSILPHGGPGFGGGAKLVLPGVAGVETIYQNHRPDNRFVRGVDRLEGNTMRADMEEVAAMAGLDFIVNTVVNPRREVAGLFCGHFIAAHRAGCELARTVYDTAVPQGYDVAILSAYPKDSDCYQAGTALSPIRTAVAPVVHDDGTVVVASAGSQGMGEHFLNGPGFRLGVSSARPEGNATPRQTTSNRQGMEQLLFCENVSERDVERWGGDSSSLCRTWGELVRRLRERYGDRARVALFPCAAMQIVSQTASSP